MSRHGLALRAALVSRAHRALETKDARRAIPWRDKSRARVMHDASGQTFASTSIATASFLVGTHA